MALTRFFFLTSLVLFPLLLVIASANDYGYSTPNPKNQDPEKYDLKPKPDEVAENDGAYEPKSKPVEEEEEVKKYDYSLKPKLEETKKSIEYEWKQKEDHDDEDEKEKEKKGYAGNYGAEEEKKNSHGYEEGVEVSYGFSKTPKHQEEEKEFSIGFEGFVLCKSGLKYYPIQGAVAKIKCLVEDENGYERAPVTVSSCPADEKGYFLGKVSESYMGEKLKIKECKAFIERSPLETCNIPCDVNKGITGALLSAYRVLNEKYMKLYSVGPFFFTPKTEPAPGHGY
ncbi:uncharacterized protein LOC110825228 [Carica papaya]|uniref:uncharacterized protein LOC110825228 n=1 Tax=Carica papaya TaxID=3649 RepID=UPI000B8C7A93|nr:uncharacterized protein LOC110825228 [Carica papaya]